MKSPAWSPLVLLAMLVSGGCASSSADNPDHGQTGCSASTCTGCCQGGICIAPPSATACGAGGAACVMCSPSDSCNEGMCVPMNCAGCIDQKSVACLPGTSASSCGTGGAFCAACTSGNVCQEGRCGSACAGCIDPTNTCQPGTINTACGAGGLACVSCSASQVCDDRQCVTPPSCGSANCGGCCDDNDACQPGTTPSDCGAGGGRCASCGGGSGACNGGACSTGCDATNCTGCCNSSGQCEASSTASCGIGGAACQACGSGEACSNGSCIANDCKSSCSGCCDGSSCEPGTSSSQCGASGNACSPCITGQVCTNNACQVDPSSLWDLVFLSGTAPLYDMNGDTWDAFGGLPDPYMEVDVDYGQADEVDGYTDFVDNTLTPDWDATSGRGIAVSGLTASLLLKTSYLQMWDSDAPTELPGYDDSMGRCSFSITQNMFDGQLLSFTCAPPANTAGVTWSVNFKLVPHVDA